MLVDVECLVQIFRTSGLIAANPMPLAGRTKVLKTLPKTLPRGREVSAVVEAIMSP